MCIYTVLLTFARMHVKLDDYLPQQHIWLNHCLKSGQLLKECLLNTSLNAITHEKHQKFAILSNK